MVQILLLHTDQRFRDHYQKLLEKKGYQVDCLDNGCEGIHQAYQMMPDLVIADVQLKEMNGYQVCRLLKNDQATQKIPFILVSQKNTKMDKFWSFKAGADVFLSEDEIEIKLVKEVGMLLEVYGRLRSQEKQQFSQVKKLDDAAIRGRLIQILDQTLVETILINEFRNLTDLIHDKGLLNYMLFSLLEKIIDFDLAGIFYNDANRETPLLTFYVPEETHMSGEILPGLQDKFFETLVDSNSNLRRSFQRTEFDTIGNVSEDEPPVSFQSIYVKEFEVNSELVGAFVFYSKIPVQYENIFPIQIILNELELLMKLRHLYSRAENLAVSDGMTGLFNYRHFMLIFEREFRRSRRYELPISIAIIDIDHFKNFNDTWGHLAGDEVIKKIASEATDCFRGVDLIARYGGEEFVVVFPETEMANARNACERFRQRIQNVELEWEGDKLAMTVSVGLAELSPTMETASELIRKADEALYMAKNNGRNRTEPFLIEL